MYKTVICVVLLSFSLVFADIARDSSEGVYEEECSFFANRCFACVRGQEDVADGKDFFTAQASTKCGFCLDDSSCYSMDDKQNVECSNWLVADSIEEVEEVASTCPCETASNCDDCLQSGECGWCAPDLKEDWTKTQDESAGRSPSCMAIPSPDSISGLPGSGYSSYSSSSFSSSGSSSSSEYSSSSESSSSSEYSSSSESSYSSESGSSSSYSSGSSSSYSDTTDKSSFYNNKRGDVIEQQPKREDNDNMFYNRQCKGIWISGKLFRQCPPEDSIRGVVGVVSALSVMAVVFASIAALCACCGCLACTCFLCSRHKKTVTNVVYTPMQPLPVYKQ